MQILINSLFTGIHNQHLYCQIQILVSGSTHHISCIHDTIWMWGRGAEFNMVLLGSTIFPIKFAYLYTMVKKKSHIGNDSSVAFLTYQYSTRTHSSDSLPYSTTRFWPFFCCNTADLTVGEKNNESNVKVPFFHKIQK